MIKSNTKKKKNLKADCLKPISSPLLVFTAEKEDDLFILLPARHVPGGYSYLHPKVKVSGVMAAVQMK